MVILVYCKTPTLYVQDDGTDINFRCINVRESDVITLFNLKKCFIT